LADRLQSGEIPITTLAQILHGYQHRPEHKSLNPDHTPAGRDSNGLLTRRPVTSSPSRTELTGKEGNNLEQRATGEQTNPDQYRNTYGRRKDDWAETLAILKTIPVPQLVEETGFSRSAIYAVLNGAMPHPSNRTIYERLVQRLSPRDDEVIEALSAELS
jgi:hypothetical protein